jgi:hypothetical protein
LVDIACSSHVCEDVDHDLSIGRDLAISLTDMVDDGTSQLARGFMASSKALSDQLVGKLAPR